MTNPVTVGIIVAIFSSLLTFTVTKVTSRTVRQHEEVFHQDSLYSYTEAEITKHRIACGASEKLKKIEKVVIAIFIKQGGNIEELDI